MISHENDTGNSGIALSQSKGHCRAPGGRTLKQLVQEALSEKITRLDGASRQQKPWMVLAGGLKHLRSENRRIERLIEAEFENIEPEDRQ